MASPFEEEGEQKTVMRGTSEQTHSLPAVYCKMDPRLGSMARKIMTGRPTERRELGIDTQGENR